MKQNKRIAALALCVALLLAVAGCAFAEAGATRSFQLGTSGYSIEIPDSFTEGELTREDIADDMVAYMLSPDTLLDFDVYQFGKEDVPEKLADYVEYEAEEYEAFEIVTDGEINGIAAGWYLASELYAGEDYITATYILEDGDEYVEVVFWLDGEEAVDQAQAIIDTLKYEAK